MKSKPEILAKNRKHIMHVFTEAMAYRVPLPASKVIVCSDDTTYPICPRCSRSIEREYMSFCDRCGQKLNWDFFEYTKICRPNYKYK